MNRRRFLSFLGFGAVAGPAAVSAAPSFIEAQPPSAINDAARAAMAWMGEFRDANASMRISMPSADSIHIEFGEWRPNISPYKLRL